MILTVKIDRGETSWGISANDPSVSGSVYAVGDTMDEALREFRSALEFHLEGLREDGLDVTSVDQLNFEFAPPSANGVANFVNHSATVDPGNNAFPGGYTEVTETDEVPVIAKTARVVEEVVVGKPAIGSPERATKKTRQADSSVSNDSITSARKPFGK